MWINSAISATVTGLAVAGIVALVLFVIPHWTEFRFYNWAMTVERKPEYTLAAFMRNASWLPLTHGVFTRMWLVVLVASVAAAGIVTRWRLAHPAERLAVLWLLVGLVEVVVHDSGNERRYVMFVPALIALASLRLAPGQYVGRRFGGANDGAAEATPYGSPPWARLATVLTVLGHTVLGFEQPWSMVVVALVTGYASALLFEAIDARANGRTPGYIGGGIARGVDFLLSAHMTAITTSFLLYTNSRVGAMAFAVAAGIGSKYVFRVPVDGRLQHFMNPSNFGIVLTLLLFPWVSTMPYIFTARVSGAWDVVIPLVMAALGFRLNLLFAKRLPLIGAWVAAFVLQAVARWLFVDDINLLAALAPMTGATFVLFTFYMITDPRTTPSSVGGQIAFGLSIGAAYALVVSLHIVFTFFFAVTFASLVRGAVLLHAARWRLSPVEQPLGSEA